MEGKKKILVVDDDSTLREIYADIFRANGFEVEEAADGMEGLDKALKIRPDAILSGIIMPKMDGFSLKEMLSKNVATNSIPVFVSSHRGREEDRQKAEELGCKGFFVQGLDMPKDIVEKIKNTTGDGEYKLKVSGSELDASRIVGDLGLGEKLHCQKCGEELVVSLRPIDSSSENKFYASFVCPNCGK